MQTRPKATVLKELAARHCVDPTSCPQTKSCKRVWATVLRVGQADGRAWLGRPFSKAGKFAHGRANSFFQAAVQQHHMSWPCRHRRAQVENHSAAE